MAVVLEHRSEDVDDQAESLQGWEQRYEQLGCGRFHGSVWQVVMERGTLLRESTNRQLREQIVPPPDHVVLAVPLQAAPGSVFGGRALCRESLMVLSGADEYDVVAAGALDLVALSVHRSLLGSMLAPAKVEWLAQAERQRNVPLAPAAADAVRNMLLAACEGARRQIEEFADVGNETEVITDAIAQAVVLAMSGDGAEHRSGIPRRADSRMRVVKRAVDFVRGHLQDDIGIPEVCAAACASRRSLQYCFEEFLHTTPLAYLRALRLNEARRQLKLHGDQPITALANTMGFSSASHFTRHYKLMFDELPSQTMRINCYGPGGV